MSWKKDTAEFFQGKQVAEMAALLDETAKFVRYHANHSNR
jgi:hypothetical protein